MHLNQNFNKINLLIMKEKKKIDLCLFTFNELEGLKYTLKHINKKKFNIFVVDANSNDGTIEFLRKKKIRFFIQKFKDYNSAYLIASKKSYSNKLIVFHPKKTIPIKTIYLIKKKLYQGYDIVFTTRMSKLGDNEEDGKILKPRKWFVLFLSIVINLIYRKKNQNKISDPLHGIKGFDTKKFNKIGINKKGVTADLEMCMMAMKKNLCFTELPVKEKSRRYGKTNFPALKTGSKILIFLFFSIIKKIIN